MMPEPELEELSAYLDKQLPAERLQELEAHLHGCEICGRRLEALRLTVRAVRTLPMESPPRPFTIPSRVEPAGARRWARLAWAGGLVAAALLVVMAGYVVVRHPAGQGASSLQQFSGLSEAPRAQSEAPATDRAAIAADANRQFFALSANQATVVDPRDPSRRLTVSTDSGSYSPDGVMTVRLLREGAPVSGSMAGITLTLVRNGLAVELPPPSEVRAPTPGAVETRYRLSDLPLAAPRAGTYRLVATWSLPNAPGSALVAEVMVTLT